ncbi:hypothetical protein C8R47DRAFT_1073816 [Mycena vitilis]|nr:hypothetical protein C8R47DRAFT_1073816 [Mycena vitilis]
MTSFKGWLRYELRKESETLRPSCQEALQTARALYLAQWKKHHGGAYPQGHRSRRRAPDSDLQRREVEYVVRQPEWLTTRPSPPSAPDGSTPPGTSGAPLRISLRPWPRVFRIHIVAPLVQLRPVDRPGYRKIVRLELGLETKIEVWGCDSKSRGPNARPDVNCLTANEDRVVNCAGACSIFGLRRAIGVCVAPQARWLDDVDMFIGGCKVFARIGWEGTCCPRAQMLNRIQTRGAVPSYVNAFPNHHANPARRPGDRLAPNLTQTPRKRHGHVDSVFLVGLTGHEAELRRFAQSQCKPSANPPSQMLSGQFAEKALLRVLFLPLKYPVLTLCPTFPSASCRPKLDPTVFIRNRSKPELQTVAERI